ncbi:MAG: PAS domain S-box protein [Acidobacteria bacterium]|nr:PAS domain S-box protein [Acidobacteriota bacterium]
MSELSISKRNLQWMLLIRVILVTILLGSALTIQIVYSDAPEYRVLYFFIGFTYLFTIFYGLFYKLLSAKKHYIYLQLVIDAFMISLLIYFTGAYESRFKMLYIIPIIAASMLLYKRGAVILSVTSFLMYGGIINLVYHGIIYDQGVVSLRLIPFSTLIYDLFYHLFVFTFVAFIIAILAEAKRKTGKSLERASVKLDDLKVFNRNVIDSMRTGLITTDLGGWIISYNRIAEVYADQIGRKIKNEKLTDFLGLDEEGYASIKNKLLIDDIYNGEVTFTQKNGEQIILTYYISILPNSKGEKIGYIINFHDITELRQLEIELKMKDKLAALGSMAASIAHEIRNPLAAISGSAQELGNSQEMSSHELALLDIIVKETKRLNNTVRHYLEYTKAHPFVPVRMDINKAMNDIIQLIKKDPKYTNLKHDIKFKPLKSGKEFQGDVDALKQVFWNLILNSLQAMNSKGLIEINFSENKDKTGLSMIFKDNGVGISDDQKTKIFEPVRTNKRDGSGLGLSIVYKIITEHSGSIQVGDNYPIGTVIKILLPYLDYTENLQKEQSR